MFMLPQALSFIELKTVLDVIFCKPNQTHYWVVFDHATQTQTEAKFPR